MTVFRHGDAATAAALLPHLDRGRDATRAALLAAWALSEAGVPPPLAIQERLIPLLDTEDSRNAWFAEALLHRGSPRVHLALLDRLQSLTDAAQARRVARAVCNAGSEPSSTWGPEEAVHTARLVGLLSAPTYAAVRAGLALLADVGPRAAAAEAPVLAVVRDRSRRDSIRAAAIQCLTALGVRDAAMDRELAEVLASFGSESVYARLAVRDRIAVPAAVAALRYKSPLDVDPTLAWLGSLGAEAEAAVPALVDKLDEWPWIAHLAHAIVRIDPSQVTTVEPFLVAEATKPLPDILHGPLPIHQLLQHGCRSDATIALLADTLRATREQRSQPTRALLEGLARDASAGHRALVEHLRATSPRPDAALLEVMVEAEVDAASAAAELTEFLLQMRDHAEVDAASAWGMDTTYRTYDQAAELLGDAGPDFLPVLAELLAAADPNVRLAATHSILPLCNRTSDARELVRDELLAQLLRLDRARRDVYRVWPEDAPPLALGEALARHGASLVSPLRDALRAATKDALQSGLAVGDSGEAAVVALGYLGPVAIAAAPEIAALLGGAKAPAVEASLTDASLAALVRIGELPETARHAVIAWLGSRSEPLTPRERHNIGRLFARHPTLALRVMPTSDAAITEALHAALDDIPHAVRPPRGLDAALGSEHPSTRLAALQLLRRMPQATPEEVAAATAILSDKNWRLRWIALETLERHGDEAQRAAARRQLALDGDLFVRQRATELAASDVR